MQGCFEVIRNSNCEYDIECRVIVAYSEDGIPEEQNKLYCEVERTTSIIKSLKFTDKIKKDEYFEKLLTLTQIGLTGPAAQPELAINSLYLLKEDIVNCESGRIKNKYMIDLGKYGLVLIGISSIILLILKYFSLEQVNKYIYTFDGSVIGAWISFGARKIELKFEELAFIEKDKLNPIIRLIFVGISSMILLLFIDSEIIKFQIGSITNNQITSSIKLQVLVGVIAGLIEYKLAINLFNKANTMEII
ncbi:hypothetical protein M3X99_01000 [Clostridium perfringens]|uniref:hypothetical protein n=1 Tax=Clostridium perfringens TaxID=1502 RepID=UPI001C8481A2|nr:hypothetical protein [Clostridium perfringens]ELC8418778.1 hypothetical protein [Clostridium perfringens]MDC4249588.1 hypothetical protein [Clostridium perfringens]MDU1258349.1 hypothetical protein [Clostridium perfringens]